MKRAIAAVGEFLRRADMLLFGLCVLASVFGIVMISSATRAVGADRYVSVQTAALILGILVYVLLTLIDIDIIAERRELLFLFNVLFIATLIPFGVEGSTGNRSWLRFSWLPFGIQPAEICKISFILIMAKTMSISRERISALRPVGVITAHMLVMVGLIVYASSDAGMALVFALIYIIMAYAGGVGFGWFLAGAGAVAAAAPLLWTRVMRDDQKQRILMIFDPTIDPDGLDIRYQTRISTSYIKSGGLAGQGLYEGTQTQAGILPAQHTDFIFSSIGEELGILGCVAVLVLLGAIVARCVYVGVKSGNYMNRLICVGIAGMLICQTFINVGMCVGVFPVIGLTLPFFSYGGSSLLTMFLAAGIVSGIHMRPAPDANARYIRPKFQKRAYIS